MSGTRLWRTLAVGALVLLGAAVFAFMTTGGPPPTRAWFPEPGPFLSADVDTVEALKRWARPPSVSPGGSELSGEWEATAGCGQAVSPDSLSLARPHWFHPLLRLVGRTVAVEMITYEFGTTREVDGNMWIEYVRPFDRTLGDRPAAPEALVGAWEHSVLMGEPTTIELASDGTIVSEADGATWSLDGVTLELRWPREDIDGGVWIDSCEVAPDALSYRGFNQDLTRIDGRRPGN